MSGIVSTRWFWSDWMSDPCVRACSYAARGLWMDLLCIMAANKGRDHGFLSLNGHRLTEDRIAKLTNGVATEVFELLQELELNGVYSKDRRGVIYCRRMVKAEKNRRNGQLGGAPKHLKNKENPNSLRETAKAHIPVPVPEPLESKIQDRPSPTESTAASPKVAKRAQPRTRIPDRAVLVEGPNMDFALSKGFSSREAIAMFEEFRDYHVGKGNQMADWAAAWRTWVRNQIKFKRGGSNGKTESALGGFSGVGARLRQKIAAENADAGDDAAGGEPAHGR